MGDLLFNAPPLVVQRELIVRVGVLEALIAQQLNYWLQRSTSFHDGERWVYKTYGDWSAEIGVSSKAIRGALDRLRRDGIVVAIENPMDSRDRTLWWRIDYAVLSGEPPSGGNGPRPSGSPSAREGSPPAAVGVPNGASAPAAGGVSRARVPSPPEEAQEDETVAEITTETARERATLELVHPAPVRSVRYRSKTVPSVIVEGAERLLDVFRQEAGHGPGARSAAGDASPALKQVIGAMLARPDTSVDDWEAAIRRTVAAPPRWVDGALQIGHVFGERAAEWALSAGAPAMDGPSRLERMADELEAQGL
jgi:hypothetical protein